MTIGTGDGLFARVSQSRKLARRGNGVGTTFSVADADVFPRLMELLTKTPVEMRPPKAGRVALFVQDGKLTACLSFPAARAVAFVALDSFDKVFVDLERALGSESLEWRLDEPKNGK